MDDVKSRIIESLNTRKALGTYRTLPKSNQLIDFTSNDYLGMARSDKLKSLSLGAFAEGNIPMGSTGSRLLSGNSAQVEETENQIAAFHGAEAGLLFNSGYIANIGLFSTLPQKGDTILYDSLCHASIKYGIRLSNAKAYAFKHNDLSDLERKVEISSGNVFVVTESLFSMDGDFAPLVELAGFCEKKNCSLIVDEAHTTGMSGGKGEGLVSELGLENKVFARIHTFGKALGLQGGIVVGPEILRQYLINYCPSFIYSTGMSPFSVLAIKAAYDLLPEMAEEREKVFTLQEQLKQGLMYKSKYVFQGKAAVNCLLISGNEKARQASAFLESKGFDVKPILSPTVPKGLERIRICLHAYNTKEELDALIEGVLEFENYR